MSVTTVNKARVLAAIRRAVKRRGKMHVGGTGKYFDQTGRPACLLGDIIYHEFGLRKNHLGEYTNTSGVTMLEGKLRDKGIVFTDEAREILRLAQSENDRQVAWGQIFRDVIRRSKK